MSRSAVRLVGRTAAIVLGLGLLRVIAVYGGSEVKLRHQYPLASHPPFVTPANPDSALVVRGQHVADPMAKCAECHGPGMAGPVFIDEESVPETCRSIPSCR